MLRPRESIAAEIAARPAAARARNAPDSARPPPPPLPARAAPRAICLSGLCQNYDHKHQEISPRDADKGLDQMAIDIAASLFHRMAAEGIKLDAGLFDTLLSAYSRQAEDTLRFYNADSVINGLHYPRHEEESAVSTFVRSIRRAAREYLEDPLSALLIPNWNRVGSALPNFLAELHKAVRLDNA